MLSAWQQNDVFRFSFWYTLKKVSFADFQQWATRFFFELGFLVKNLKHGNQSGARTLRLGKLSEKLYLNRF